MPQFDGGSGNSRVGAKNSTASLYRDRANSISSRSIVSQHSRTSNKIKILRAGSPNSEDDASTGDSTSDDENYSDMKTLTAQGEIPQDFWQIQKLIRYLKIGNQTATVIALCVLNDFDLTKEYAQLAIMDAGGLEVLSNLLETDEMKCKVGALRILRRITVHPAIRKKTTLMGGIDLLIKILSDPDPKLQLLAAETMANLAKFRNARTIVRKNEGIPKLIDILDIDLAKLPNDIEHLDDHSIPIVLQVARGSAFALWSLSKSKRNKLCIKKAGGLPLLARLVKLRQTSILIPVIGTLQECASEKSYCLAMQSEGMIEDLVRNLSNPNPKLKMLCASAIFRLAEEKESRQLVRAHGGLEPLVILIDETANHENRPHSGHPSQWSRKVLPPSKPSIQDVIHKFDDHHNRELMAAVSGAIWKCAFSAENVTKFQDLGLVEVLIRILKDNCDALDDLQFNPQKISVLTNVVGALAECAKNEQNVNVIKDEAGLEPLIKLINTTHPDLLVNVSLALGRCAEDKNTLINIHELDGVRLIWSLLKNTSDRVQASAAWALSPCIRNAPNSGDMVRSFVGGLELICGLLESRDIQVLSAVCYAIANIAKDKENLAVITDHGVIEKLSRLANTDSDLLRAKLAQAIGNCCDWAGNRALFGQSGAVAPLVSYLTTTDLEVHRSTSVALYQLSKDPWNCVTMHQNGVVPHLLRLIGSQDEDVQEASADCLQNIRKLALACEKFRYQHLKT
ncbi:outer dynein arm-docking complex subunit 2-like isoform X1 [Tigriopus californicus]|uniref:outer dynein arm-docking complex subunit 2-like isoform X1 n=1 Tax=Tigriopus californicus TaxID=6832 RepID=UPI0027DA8A12|nr:outer dynein arm-docking complex subunit 2-like isoform X1 [Tigriopus californicus]XP_059095177.1 outer dynein arm-docking complex subunit 2-like isoform X1 [Tigriopus californicus]